MSIRHLGVCLAFAWILAAVGCASYNVEALRDQMAQGQYDKALDKLSADTKLTLPYLLELGLVAHYADHYATSNTAFQIAEVVSDDLYTRRLSREIAAFVTSDNTRPYGGTRYERLLIHYYRALNYVYMNAPDDALVEVRRAGRLLQAYADEDSSYEFAGAAFFAYFSAILYEWTGDINDAYVSYRIAERGYKAYSEAHNVAMPRDIGHSLARLARELGFDDEAAQYQEKYGEPTEVRPDWGEFILIYESGFAPRKVEDNIVLPILKTDEFDDGGKTLTYAETVSKRRGRHYEEVTIEYLLRVAIPRHVPNPPSLVGVEARADGRSAKGAMVEDLNRVMARTFQSELPMILLRTTARGIVKYLSYRKAKQQGSVAGFLVNALNVVTESADTRSWQTLPAQLHIVRLRLPPGTHDIRLDFLGRDGRIERSHIVEDVEIAPDDKRFLNFRTYE